MNDAQTWTAIGGFLGLLTVGQGLVVGLMLQVMNARFDAVGAQIGGLSESVDGRFDAVTAQMRGLAESVDARFDAVDERFARVDQRLDLLDRDVQRLVDAHFREQ